MTIDQLFHRTKQAIDCREVFILDIWINTETIISDRNLQDNLDFFFQVALLITKIQVSRWGQFRKQIEDIIELRKQNE